MSIITEELAKELNLTQEQVTAINPKIEDHISTQKKEWDGKANTDAENIISGAAEAVAKKFGFEEKRAPAEKAAEYFTRVSEKAFSAQKTKVETLKAEYAQKLKDFKGDEATKAELDKAKADLDSAKQKLADYDTLSDKASKYETLSEQYSSMKLEVAFSNVKPSFPETVNKYEADAKWNEFKKSILDKNNIELVDGVPMAIDKENQYKQLKLSDLVSGDANLSELLKGRHQGGTGTNPANVKVEGLDFEVPETAKTNSAERTKIIQEQLAKEGIGKTSLDYSEKFAEYNKKILAAK